jgi:uncharacterized membrane protein YfcA
MRSDAWERAFWLWEILFAVSYAGTTVLVLFEDSDATDKTVAVLCLAGIALAYLIQGRRVIQRREDGPRPWPFVGVLLILLTVALFAETTSSFILFLVCPVLYMTLELKTASILTTAAVLLGPLASIANGTREPGRGTGDGRGAGAVRARVGLAGGSLAASGRTADRGDRDRRHAHR